MDKSEFDKKTNAADSKGAEGKEKKEIWVDEDEGGEKSFWERLREIWLEDGKTEGKTGGASGTEKPAYKPTKKSAGGTTELRKRTQLLMLVIIAGFILVIGMLSYYQIFDREQWLSRTTDQQLSDITIPAKRGSIYDINGETIVQSTTAWIIYLRPSTINADWYRLYRDVVIQKLCETVGFTETYLEKRLEVDAIEVKLNVKINKNQYDELNSFLSNYLIDEDGEPVASGVTFYQDTQRSYAHGNLLSTVLGFCGIDNNGLYALEVQYDEILSGVAGRLVTVQNAKEGDMPFEYTTLIEAQDGNSLVLSIDANVQQVLEKYLTEAYVENKVQNRACGIIMNVNTGAILGMSTIPDYDPSSFTTVADEKAAAQIEQIVDKDERNAALATAQQIQWRNKCITESYEPGSVFKPVVMSAALEEGLTSLNERFYCPGSYTYSGGKISCHRKIGHGSESLTQGMMNSCNPVFMTLGERLGAESFYEYFAAFGFTEKTGIDLPGESQPVAGVNYHTVKSLQDIKRNLLVSSFGQSNTATPMQMITAISAIANGGYLMQPYIVEQIIDGSGNLVSTTEPTVKRQVVSEETSEIVCTMLEATVSDGTAKNGYIAGYRIGGKTGTSEKLAETAASGLSKYVASYCAIAPSDDPEIALLIILDEPTGASHMGGTIAAPVARNVLNEVLPYLGIETIYSSDDIARLDTITPNLYGKSLEDAKTVLKDKDLKVRVIGGGDTVTSQIPQAGQSIPQGGMVVISTNEDGEIPSATVPDVAGMTPAEANREITDAGLNIRFGGTGYDTSSGIAKSQSIPSGTEVSAGTVVTVEFIMGGATD